MSYDQKALEKLFAPKPISETAESPATIETVADVQLIHKGGCKEISDLPISDLTDYPKQLFKPYSEEKLKKLEMSIRENGVIYPLIVRAVDGKYQIVCGHNRKRAATQADFETVPCIIEEMIDDEADLKMVETNLQTRAGLLPSEKGFAYKLKLDAMKHQGLRTDLSFGTVVPKLSREVLSEQVSESERQIANYIRLTYLITPLLDFVDDNTVSIKAAVELSFLDELNQNIVCAYFFVSHKINIDEQLAKRLKEQSRIENLTEESISALLPPAQGKTVKQTSKLSIPTKPLMKLLDTSALAKDVEKEILDVLIDYFKKKMQDRE